MHARMIEDTLGNQFIGHISRDSAAIEARQAIAKKDKVPVDKAQAKKQTRSSGQRRSTHGP